MDFALYGRVLWRFKWLVLLGLLAAVALAGLSVVRVTTSGKISYRQSELWSSTTRLGVTQVGFPWGRLLAQQPVAPGDAPPTAAQQAAALGIPVADPNRLNNLAVLYSELVTSDPIRRLMRALGPTRGQLLANPLVQGDNRIMLPLIDLTAIADSPQAAKLLAAHAATALASYVRDQQVNAKVPPSDRVLVEEVASPIKADVFRPRSKTMPVVIFLGVMLATVGVAFLLENARPRKVATEEEEVVPAPRTQAASAQ